MICDRQAGIDRVYDRNGSKRGRYECKIEESNHFSMRSTIPNKTRKIPNFIEDSLFWCAIRDSNPGHPD